MHATTFTHSRLDVLRAQSALIELGFDVGEPSEWRRTILDTFDGRLYGRAMRLDVLVGDHIELVLCEGASLPVSVGVPVVPRFASDLAVGPFRARLEAVVEMRAVMPLTTFVDRQARVVRRDRRGHVIASGVLHWPVGELPWTLDIVELPGESRHSIVGELAVHGFEDADVEIGSMVLAATGIDPRGYRHSPSVDLRRDDPSIEAFARVLLNLSDAIEANWNGTINDIDSEFLHELRVALRRTRAIVGHGRNVLPDDLQLEYRPKLAELAALTGPTRDLDVYLLEWPSYVAPFDTTTAAALAPVLDHLHQHRDATRAALVEALSADASRTMIGMWRASLTRLAAAALPEGSVTTIGAVVGERLARSHDRLVRDGGAIGPSSPATDLHELRKDAKKLRYLVECFATLMPADERKAFVTQLKGLQDNLGQHQDAEVHAVELRRVATEMADGDAPRLSLLALGQITEQLEQLTRSARAEFAERFAEYDSKATRRLMTAMVRSLAEADRR